jgi:adenosylhomocysteinase
MADSTLRDMKLWQDGASKIEWAREHMPVVAKIRGELERIQPFSGQRVAMSIHLEAKTACLALALQSGGAQVSLTGSNPLSTQDDVAAAVARGGVEVHAWHGATDEEYFDHLNRVLDCAPTLVLDDGGDLTALLHSSRTGLSQGVIGGCEETTTGVLRLRALESQGRLLFPMIAVNGARCKHLFDNRYGTGQSVWDGIMRTTNLVVAGKIAVIAGYGWCGKGVAARARGLGARVIVTEVDPVKANEALMDGYDVLPMAEAVKNADVIITVTGCNNVIGEEHVDDLKDGVILANAGHFDVEISKPALRSHATSVRRARKNIDEYRLPDGRNVYLLAEGRLVNLAAGDGHPAEIMDMSFALQLLCLRYVVEQGSELSRRVMAVPAEIDERVASLRLEALGVSIDKLSQAQIDYLSGWTGAE